MTKEELKVGIIGCGRSNLEEQGRKGISHLHAQGYLDVGETRIVALADIVPEYAEAFRERFGGERIYTDYREMLEKEALDVVSVCTWPHLHAEMVVAAAQAGIRAVHCEKPMATTYGDARRMVEACAEREAKEKASPAR